MNLLGVTFGPFGQFNGNGLAQTLSISLDGLAPGATTASALTQVYVPVNGVPLFGIDVLVSVRIVTFVTGPNASILVSAFGSCDGNFDMVSDNVPAPSGGVFTPTNPSNLPPFPLIQTPTLGNTYDGGPWSWNQFFGTPPPYIGIAVTNTTGTALGIGCKATIQAACIYQP